MATIGLVVAGGVAFVARKMLRDAGFLKGSDCGCGKCAARAAKRARR